MGRPARFIVKYGDLKYGNLNEEKETGGAGALQLTLVTSPFAHIFSATLKWHDLYAIL